MSSTRNWDDQSRRKEQRSIYLTDEDWDYLRVWGKGSQTQAIRNMIMNSRETKQNEEIKSPKV